MESPNILQILGSSKSDYITTTTNTAHHYDVFIDTDIGEPQEYRELLSILFNASEYDTMSMFINSVGGSLDTALAIIEGVKNTNASVTAFIVGACHSAASMIVLYCHQVIVLDSAYMMVHTASYGTVGNVNNVKSHTEFITTQVEKLLDDTYEGFLTKDESLHVKQGMEMWFPAEQIRERLSKRVKVIAARSAKEKKTTKRQADHSD